ncbi:Protein YrdA [BD1-7 clade bacterium]|uniref:Protein YrdA n=1 Tax=BD1-7 clade bacterium TaxID=2029982 RepID=A0A5S9Q7G8_9GAMM|nr:Protein YrdA [BD1-7 clade bacterium]CAA0114758.1 Protein YrdA [BD1-7 clade bacterium]
MNVFEIDGKAPSFDGEGHFIAPTATLIGDVRVKSNASIWFNTVIRAENDVVTIGENTNIQDLSMLHVDPGFPLHIGDNVTVGHKVMLHGCSIGEGTLIGMNAVVLNGARIGKGCLIGANALITEGMEIPDGSMVLGSPGKIVKTLDEETRALLLAGAGNYVKNADLFNRTLRRVAADHK